MRFKLHRIKADWFRQENDCISAMSALRMTTWKSGGNVKNRLASNNLETREISDYRTSLLDLLISFINAKGIYYIYITIHTVSTLSNNLHPLSVMDASVSCLRIF